MFLENKYKKWYFNIVENARGRDTSSITHIEKHHVIPKSLGGNDSNLNLVSLTPREHFVCHYLLTKMTAGLDKRKMCFALSSFHRSNKHQSRILNSWEYQKLRLVSKALAKEMLDIRVFPKGKNHHMFGKTHNLESKKKIKDSKQKGIWTTPWGTFNFVSEAIIFAKHNKINPRINDNNTLSNYCRNNKKIICGKRSNKHWVGFTPLQLGFKFEEYNGRI